MHIHGDGTLSVSRCFSKTGVNVELHALCIYMNVCVCINLQVHLMYTSMCTHLCIFYVHVAVNMTMHPELYLFIHVFC